MREEADPDCLLMAEHLPNEWSVTRAGGPMDTQCCDDFHDRLEDACRGDEVMPALASALLTTHRECDDWFEATNYPESHDEVGNENDRIANIAGWGRGLRMSKVAAGLARHPDVLHGPRGGRALSRCPSSTCSRSRGAGRRTSSSYREWLNSTWPAFAVEGEDEHTNGGRDARLRRGNALQVPDHGVVVLQRM